MDRLRCLPALQNSIHVHKSKTSLSQLRTGFRPSMFFQINTVASFRYYARRSGLRRLLLQGYQERRTSVRLLSIRVHIHHCSDRSHRHSQSVHAGNSSRHRSARELADAELQRAIQLSLEESSRTTSGHRPGYVSSQPDPSRWQASEPPIVEHSSHPRRAKSLPPPDEEDEDLKAAIEASLREANAPKASAPEVLPTPQSEYPPRIQPQSSIKLPNYDLQPTESDAILRFSQQVEQAQASGRKDIVRYPDVSELYETASGLRSKLALSLDDTGKKERESPDSFSLRSVKDFIPELLTEMHEKMSQIVKLYDGLLSEQLSHPRWKTQSLGNAPSPQQYQQANSVYSMGYNPVNGYTQWNQAQAPQASASLQQQTWHTQQQAPIAEPAQYQYVPPQRQQQQSEHAQPGLSHHQSQPAYPQYQQAQSYYASPAAPSEPYQPPSAVPISAVPYQTSTPQSQVPPTPYQPQPVTQPTLPVFVPQSPPIMHYSPPTAPTPVAPSLPPTSPTLSRQNTISTYLPQTQTPVQSSASPSAPSSSSYPSRSNTITTSHSYHPQQQQQPQIIQQPSQSIQSPQQQLPTFPPVSALPVFPSAPTAAPQLIYQQPQQQPQPEREALLIEL